MPPRHLMICTRTHDPRGGADRIVVDLVRELPRRGWKVTLALTEGARFNVPSRFLEMYQDVNGISLDGRLGTRRSRLRSIRTAIREIRPDVVLGMRVFDSCEATALEKPHFPNLRYAMGLRAFEAPYLKDAELFRNVTDVCVTSGELIAQALIQECGYEKHRVESIGGGIHSPRVPRIERLPNAPIRLVYAGRLDKEQKRALDLIPFVEHLDRLGVRFQLQIVGSGECETELRFRLKTFISRGCVTMPGWRTQDELYQEVYPATDLFVHFAAWEGMTIAPREAMAHGAPAIVSAFQGQKVEGLFRHMENSLVFEVGDTKTAAEHVKRVDESPELWKQLSREATASQGGRYSFEGALDAWAICLEECCERPACRGTFPRVPERISGRLSNMGIPSSWQAWAGSVLGRQVAHSSPGSEWPTSSGLCTHQDETRFRALGDRILKSSRPFLPANSHCDEPGAVLTGPVSREIQ